MKRGDLVTVAPQGDYDKPRPALIVQADQFADLKSVVILPITSMMVDAPLLRLTLEPSPENGLRQPSQIVLDKPMTFRAEKIGPTFGYLDAATMVSVSRSLALFLGVVG